ncbi:hypothetical protein Ddc_03555 [Ditylenchus destructor]|nr:hypothetical protein Ddc_03555 [Ditylenchus destructor]
MVGPSPQPSSIAVAKSSRNNQVRRAKTQGIVLGRPLWVCGDDEVSISGRLNGHCQSIKGREWGRGRRPLRQVYNQGCVAGRGPGARNEGGSY